MGRGCRASVIGLAAVAALASWPLSLAAADEPAAGKKPRAVARLVTEKGSLAARRSPDAPWQVVEQNQGVEAGDLLVGGYGATLDSNNGSVRLVFMSDLEGRSPFPVRECAVRFRSNPEVDVDFALERGRVNLLTRKAQGPATARVHVRDESWDLTLSEPGASVALELYGRWPRGVGFTKKPGPKDVPTADMIILVLKGHMDLKHKNLQYAMAAPPGPSLIEWDSVNGQDATPHRLEKLPPWAEPGAEDTELVKSKLAAARRLRQLLATKSVEAALEELVNSEDPDDRRLAVFAMGALDDLKGLGKALREAKHRDVWDNGVLALRHWTGRAPGQDQILYRRLIEVAQFSPVEAETVLQLLHSYGEDDLARPETYETLIAYLNHKQLAVRGLAYWHLSRLVPAGKEFGYNPLDPPEKRAAAIEKWKKLIPGGQMPPRPKPAGKS